MNYYIQGDADKADKIKAAFKAKGYDISWPGGCANPDVINIGVERNGAKYVVAETAEYIKDIIKTHPNYKELELPVQPTFNVGDWLVYENGDCFSDGSRYVQVQTVEKDRYFFTQNTNGSHKFIDNHCRLWTIQDAKDGDVLAFNDNTDANAPLNWIGIYKQPRMVTDKSHWFHCIITSDRVFRDYDSWWVYNVCPATTEQRDLLFKKMKEAGYTWDDKKKELRKIQHYDIANFHAGMPVLVREYDTCHWQWVLYSHFNGVGLFFAAGKTWRQCIPFNEKTEHLLGTSDICPEEYVNW